MEPPVTPRAWSALLWGVIAGLLYLVLLGGYTLVWSAPVSMARAMAVAGLVAVATGAVSYVLEVRIARWARKQTAGEDPESRKR